MAFKEYPKRIYKGGKGYTVNNLEQEEKLLAAPTPAVPPADTAPAPQPVLLKTPPERDLPPSAEVIEPPATETVPAGAPGTEEDAVAYVMSKGYNKKAARKIVSDEGVEKILASKSAEEAEELATRPAALGDQASDPAAPGATD